jgi:solute carrier family 25 2-oxodicarboxylate transporter 21
MYPLDVAKTRAQLHSQGSVSMVNVISTIVKNEGFAKLYRGILPPILMEAPKRALKFASNEYYKGLLTNGGQVPLTQGKAIIAGVSAGCTETFVVVPFELVKIRLQAKENAGLYKNTFDCLSRIVSNEGILALYKGFESTLWRHALWNGGYFGLINYVKNMMPKPTNKKEELSTNFIAGGLSGTFGTILNTPADVVKTRIQNQDATLKPGQPRKYNWALPAIATIAREEGFTALYKGFVPKVLRLGPGGGILLVVVDYVNGVLAKMNM